MSDQAAAEQLDSFIEKEETDALDFKSSFDPASTGDWCELVKDIVAMANSGGGRIVIGANDNGGLSGYDAALFLAVDSADITNKVHKYTEQQFSDFGVKAAMIDGGSVAVLSVNAVRYPIIFTAPGEYEITKGKPKSAFRKGTVYFRHGSKSEPGTSEDLRKALERELDRVKAFWFEGITRVVQAPEGSEIQVVKSAVSVSSAAGAQAIRLTREGDGQEFRVVDVDQIYPYRSKELMLKLSERLGAKVASTHDILLVRRAHNVDDDPNFSHKGRFGSRQYSDSFVDWLVGEHGRDTAFFEKLRAASRAKRQPL